MKHRILISSVVAASALAGPTPALAQDGRPEPTRSEAQAEQESSEQVLVTQKKEKLCRARYHSSLPIAWIPAGTRVVVEQDASPWLLVSADVGGEAKKGWLYRTSTLRRAGERAEALEGGASESSITMAVKQLRNYFRKVNKTLQESRTKANATFEAIESAHVDTEELAEFASDGRLEFPRR